MGSEMCIRDRDCERDLAVALPQLRAAENALLVLDKNKLTEMKSCLLYTSDAADERSSVDLGGRRIIKKKNIGDM